MQHILPFSKISCMHAVKSHILTLPISTGDALSAVKSHECHLGWNANIYLNMVHMRTLTTVCGTNVTQSYVGNLSIWPV
jgi:hypothetical protein